LNVISFVVPAHNEEALIGDTLRILRASAEELGEPFEIIVAVDTSTDRTAEIARRVGATVVDVQHRQIAATRNAGAKAAKGDVLIFVDADTHVSALTLKQAREALQGGAVGGGARLHFASSPVWVHVTAAAVALVMRTMSWAAGCFLFVRRDAFEAVGGFDERYYATEELVLSAALKRRGRMVIVDSKVLTSGRKARTHGPGELWRFSWAFLTRGRKILKGREGLHFWYDGRR
jgi:glycosyltransferase involved in cell wall biosynthesis